MAEEETNKADTEAPSEPPLPPATKPEQVEVSSKDVAEENSEAAPPPPPPEEAKPEESKALAIVEKPADEKTAEGSVDRDAVLARVETKKRVSLIRAWEESEKSKAENKAQKKLSDIGSWENSKMAAVEAELKKIEEKLEKKKAEYVEKMKNRVAIIHKEAEEKRAIIEAKRGGDLLKAEELAAKYRIKGLPPKKLLGIF